jgi:transcription elongation GreA/GreB family factor
MTAAEKLAFKNKLKKWGLDLIGQRIATATEAMDQAQEAANSEEKSSAGDKYETGRAMGQLQKEMHARQLAESMKELASLQAISIEPLSPEGRPGAYLQGEGERQAEDIAFFISAGLGKQTIDGRTVLFLSPQAPLAKLLQGKKAGDQFSFNKTTVQIHDVF